MQMFVLVKNKVGFEVEAFFEGDGQLFGFCGLIAQVNQGTARYFIGFGVVLNLRSLYALFEA
jgi:hypothetical protein